jgi:hypothetical protein
LLIKISSPNKIAEGSFFIKHSAFVKIASKKHLGFALNNESSFKPTDALIAKEKIFWEYLLLIAFLFLFIILKKI